MNSNKGRRRALVCCLLACGYGGSPGPACWLNFRGLEFAQQWQQSFCFPVSHRAGMHWVLQRNGVQLRLLAHPLIFSSGEFHNFLTPVAVSYIMVYDC